jgi:tetratricopeptide (TPR) repeat protein
MLLSARKLLSGPRFSSGRGLAAGAAVVLCLLTGQAQAAELDHSAEYADCMKLAEQDPRVAYDSGLYWSEKGGGRPARHCVAVALIGLGQYDEAATRLEHLAQEISADTANASPKMIGELLAQSAQAWSLSGRARRALAVQTQALRLLPKDAALWVDRAVSHMSLEDYWAAVNDLSKALELDRYNRDARLYRAAAYRYAMALEQARSDIAILLVRHPEDAGALLERGILRQLAGDMAAARRDFLSAIEAGGGAEITETARARIEALAVSR